MPMLNPMRTAIAALGGFLLLFVLGQVLEWALVNAAAGAPLQNTEAYLAVRNRNGVFAGVLASNVVAALLAGYVAAKVAGAAELSHAGLAAALFAWAINTGESAAITPVWMRVTMVALTAPAMLVGASVRAKARVLQEPS
jgi:Ca2+/Na+ antiporter